MQLLWSPHDGDYMGGFTGHCVVFCRHVLFIIAALNLVIRVPVLAASLLLNTGILGM